MFAYLAIFGVGILGGLGTVFRKNYVNENINTKNSLNIYMLLAHPVAALYFLLMAGGKVPLNIPSFWFAFIYAWICMASVLVTLLAFDKINLIYIAVFSSAGGMLIPFAFDSFRGEIFSVYQYISMALRLGAVIIPLAFNKTKNRGLILCVLLFFVSGAAGILPKLYGEWGDKVVSDESFCFWTNVIIVPITVILIFAQNKPKEIASDLGKIKPVSYIYILLTTATSNIGSLAQIEIVRWISPTEYAILSSSFGMIITALISTLIYKEKMTKQSLISLILSTGAVVLGVL